MASDAQLLKRHFEQLASARLSERREKPVVLHVGKKSMMYKYTLKRFQQLLDSVDGDLTVAQNVVSVLFNAPEFSWKSRNNVNDLFGDWDAGLAIVNSIIEDTKKKIERHKPFDAEAEERWERLFGGKLSRTS